MKLNKGRMAVLAAVAIVGLLAIPIFAACPAGTIDLSDPANYGAAPAPITAAGNIVQPGTYCVPCSGVTLGAGGIPANLTVTVSNVTIVGETTSATMTGSAATMITVQGGKTGVTIQNFTMTPAGATGGIDASGDGVVIQGMAFKDAVGSVFATFAVNLNGNNPVVRNCTFDMTNSAAPAINLAGGMGALVQDNEVRGAGTKPSFFVLNDSGGAYNGLTVAHNTGDNSGSLIGVNAAADTYNNSKITDNTFTLLDGTGINLGNSPTNVQVLRNTYSYCGTGTPAGTEIGLVDGGGSNNTYNDNRITFDPTTVGKAGNDVIQFASSNTTVSGNTIDATAGDCAINASPGAGNATITNNTILGAGVAAGLPVGITGDGIKMDAAANSNFTVSGNAISNTKGMGINNGGGGTNHHISNNTLSHIGTIGIDSAGNNVISGNTISGTGGDGIRCALNDKVLKNAVSSVAGGHGIDVTGGNVQVDQNTIDGVSGGGHGINVAGANSKITNNTVNDISGGGDGIVLASNNAAVAGNTITSIHTGGRGIDIAAQNNNTVSNNTINGVSEDGIRITSGDNNKVSKNTVKNAAQDALDTAGSRFAGIMVEGPNATNNVIENNTVFNPGSTVYAVGIDLRGSNSENNDITGNTVNGFTTVNGAFTSKSIGIQFYGGKNNTLTGNTVSNPGNMRVGLDVLVPDGAPVKGNTVKGMTDIGLRLRGGSVGDKLDVQGNTLTNNVTGISIESGAATITNINKVTGGATAVYLSTLANAAYFTINGNCFGSAVLVNNKGLGTLDATGNYWATAPQIGINVFGNVDTSNALSSCPSSGGGTPPPGSSCCTYQSGWNLMSMPVAPTDPTAIPPVLNQYPFLHYKPGTGYQKPTQVLDTEGYWLYVPPSAAPLKVCVKGTSPMTDQTIPLTNKGWHQIGTGIEGAYWANTKVTYNGITKSVGDAASAGWLVPSAFAYDTQAGSYAIATILHVCQGYWVYTYKDNITITIPFNQPAPPSSSSLSMTELPAGLTPPPPPSLPGSGGNADDLTFTNEPNPVTDVHTTTFMVKGLMASLMEAIKVQIFDLSGRLVYASAEVPGTSLNWHTEDNDGKYLANGVYLYRIYALINGQWIVSKVQALVILR